MAARRHVAANPLERPDALFDDDARRDGLPPALRPLPTGDLPDVARRRRDGAADVRRHRSAGSVELGRRDLQGAAQTVEALGVGAQRAIAAPPHVLDDAGDPPLERSVCPLPAIGQPGDRSGVRRRENLDHAVAHRTILLIGYSTIPWPPAARTFGMNSRTVRSSMIVLMATHSGSLSEEMVGRCKAGRSAST